LSTVRSKSLLLYWALLASLALHLLLAFFVPKLSHLEGSESVEILSVVKIERIRVQAPRPPAERIAAAPVRAPLPHVVPRAAQTRPFGIHRPTHLINRNAVQLDSAPVAAAFHPGNATTNVDEDATPVPSATPQSQPAAAQNQEAIGGYMPLGADEPIPVLDPAVRKALLALNVHVRLTVSVDGDGHTQNVAFDPPLDAGVEAQIRSLLAAASWDPAVCGGGATCAGQAVINL